MAHGASLLGLPLLALHSEQAPNHLPEGTLLDDLYSPSGGMAPVKGDIADRIAIRQLIDAWAQCADRRLREKQANLFTEDGVVENYDGDPATHAPLSILRGRQDLFKALAVLNSFIATTHFNGQSTILLRGDHAFGESYCIAYELTESSNGKRSIELLSIRYVDDFVKRQGRWFFQKRRLIIDWKGEISPKLDAPPVAAALVSPQEHVELAQLQNEVVWRVDNRKAATIYELFVEDGSLHLDSAPIIGWKDLGEWGKALDAKRSDSIHVVTNQRFVLNGRDQASGSSILTTYSAAVEGALPAAPAAIGIDHDTYVKTAQGWRFKSRVWVPHFKS